jgi:hypothetical protein
MAVNILTVPSDSDYECNPLPSMPLGWHQRLILICGHLVAAAVPGGIITTVFQAMGMPLELSIVIGLVSASSLFIVTSIRESSSQRAEQPFLDRYGGNAVVTITNITECLSVDGLEDVGPGYIVRTYEGDKVYFAGQLVAEHDSNGESLYSMIVLTVSVSHDLLEMQCYGDLIPVSISRAVTVTALPISPTIGFAVLE